VRRKKKIKKKKKRSREDSQNELPYDYIEPEAHN